MRITAALVLILLTAPAARAAVLRWEGTLGLEPLAPGLPTLVIAGTGVATLNGSAGGSHLTALRLAAGLEGSATMPVTDPEITVGDGVVALRARATLGSGAFAPFDGSSALTQNTLPVHGLLAICLIDPACQPGGFLPIPLASQSGSAGIGVGGLISVGGAIRLSLVAGPWTLGTTFLTLTTEAGSTLAVPVSGWRHGALSFTTSTALPGGALSLVTPIRITSPEGPTFPSFGRLTIRFVPEPTRLLLLASGCLALGLLARRPA